jgi:F0F1-type ATP synthase assembly protein I
MEPEQPARQTFPPGAASGLLISTLVAAIGLGVLIGWAVGSAAYGFLVGAVVGVPLAIAVVYFRYRKALG